MFNTMTKKGMILASVFVLGVGMLAGCGKKDENAGSSATGTPAASTAPAGLKGTVTASGSTALQPLVTFAAQEFMKGNKDVTVQVTGGGSGTGVKNVADGVSEIGNSDVAAAADFKDKLEDHIVCVAPFALIVNKNVKVDNLTKQQMADIYMGKITNWKDVGGQDLKITLVHRPDSSGSRKLVQQIVLDGKDFSKEGVTQDSSKTVAEAVGKTEGAIGYVDIPYVKTYATSIKALKMDGNEYSPENIKAGKYLLYGVEHMYTKKDNTNAATKAFLDYITAKDFMSKKEVVDMGFLPGDIVKK